MIVTQQVIEKLPCGGCSYCSRAHKQWSCFNDDVNDIVPLAVCIIQAVDSCLTSGNGITDPTLNASQEPTPGRITVIHLWNLMLMIKFLPIGYVDYHMHN